MQEIWTEASASLFLATHRRAYFKSITILVPSTWSNGTYEQASSETYDTVSQYSSQIFLPWRIWKNLLGMRHTTDYKILNGKI